MNVTVVGSGAPVLLVHGSVRNGQDTWQLQRPLRDRYELTIPDRPGFPPNPAVDRVDFEEHARRVGELVKDGTHLVGFSYGGVISLFTAVLHPERIASLTLIEPPAFGLAAGRPAVDRLRNSLEQLRDSGIEDPRKYLMNFRRLVTGLKFAAPPDPLPPDLEQGVRVLMIERHPWAKNPPMEQLRRTGFPKLAVSGGHHQAFEDVCDVLTETLGARREVLRGNGHGVPQLGDPFNRMLVTFFESVS